MSVDKKDVAEAFYNVINLIREKTRKHDENPDIMRGQSKCLFLINAAGEISQRRLSEVLRIRATSLSEILGKLEKKGMVNRIQSEVDKRTYMISLTESGQEEVKNIRKKYMEVHLEWLDPLSEEEIDMFYYILCKIENICKGDE